MQRSIHDIRLLILPRCLVAGCITPPGLTGLTVRADSPEEPGAPASAGDDGEGDEGDEEDEEDEEPGLSEAPASQGASTPLRAGPRKRRAGWLIASAAAGGVALGTFIGGVTRTAAAQDASMRHDRDAFEEVQTGQYALYAVAGTTAAVSAVSLLNYLMAGGDGSVDGTALAGKWGRPCSGANSCAAGLYCLICQSKPTYCNRTYTNTGPCSGTPGGTFAVCQVTGGGKRACVFLCRTGKGMGSKSYPCPAGLKCQPAGVSGASLCVR